MPETILVINDEEPVREMITLFLQQKKYPVLEAADGPTGLDIALKKQPDLILLDVMMPGMDGYEVCAKLKQDPLTKEIPVIFLSSLSAAKDKIKGLELGGVDFVTRVSDQAELLARVQTHLKISSLTKELVLRNQELITKQKYLDEDLQAAATIQNSLLPQQQLKGFPNLHVAWKCLPCDRIGGDIFNFFRVDDDHIAFYMLDVSGHGVPSAMVTVSVCQHFQDTTTNAQNGDILKEFSPTKLLSALDKEFPLERFNKFFTIFYMILNAKTGQFFYSNGGHPPTVLLHPDRPYELLARGGTVIGVNEALLFEEGAVTLQKGDKVVLYTDGITEYQNEKGELYGSKPFYELLEKVKHESNEKVIEEVLKAILEFGHGSPAADDVSIMIIEYQ